ncbi:peptidoglycan DD-metalloendopeptidase family protein [Ectothiorhodospira magna]|uniref:peptidoglycan DD-metalloendopeptidase family protein n=1 Tax=Ectothiorhodospira magna TaxID=867345 RepID=UPI000A907D3A|nr:peptidoglycan DD-metalloendopeptidase family protein [Ectothiorhodospira magna]
MKALALIVVMVLLVSACATLVPEEPAFRSGVHTVRERETLYSIAWRYGLEWQSLAKWNGISAPYTIYPGQRLRMNPPPGQPAPTRTAATPRETRTEPDRPAASPSPPAPPAQRPSPPPATPPPRPTPPAAPAPPPAAPPARPAPPPAPPPRTSPPAATGTLTWQWPTEGQVIRRFEPQGTGKKGIAIAGQRGQPVRAAAPGRVVYSGSGLVGYGKLIIVKHDDSYLSAYGHNEKILVNEGATVSAGQRIALLGDTGTDRPMLHFEIRRDGKPVDPLRYMPRR